MEINVYFLNLFLLSLQIIMILYVNMIEKFLSELNNFLVNLFYQLIVNFLYFTTYILTISGSLLLVYNFFHD